jgi:hypothetical protein
VCECGKPGCEKTFERSLREYASEGWGARGP